MARRRHPSFGSSPRARSVLLPSGPSRGGRGGVRRAFARLLGAIAIVAVLAGAGYAVWYAVVRDDGTDARQAAAQRFATAWAHRDARAMWQALSPAGRRAHPEARFVAAYRSANKAAGVEAVRVGRPAPERTGRIDLRVSVRTDDFGTLAGVVALPVSGRGDEAGVDWNTGLRLPGLRPGEAVRRRAGRAPTRGTITAADGTQLDATGLGASIAGTEAPKPTGLQRVYDKRLGGHPSERLLFGDRQVAKVAAVAGRSVRTTIRPGLMADAAAALGDRVGGVAVVRPRDGAVLALAGLAVSAPQPPGSTFKIITASAALERGLATPATRYPVRTFATLSGTKLRNASGESCGGTLTEAFIDSCNSVFAPLGARLGAGTISSYATRFGFGETTARVPALKPSTIGTRAQLRDDLAVGAASIGQDRDLATPLEMATVAATIAADGTRARPHLATGDPVVRHKAVSAKVAHQVRAMMLGVVRSGTGTAAAIPGVEVAGKTGTAELVADSKDAKSSDAWFVAFAPASQPTVAVAVMLVGAGFGGSSAAPIAKKVLTATLER
jgi:peptidoglycan glycosyltransferase